MITPLIQVVVKIAIPLLAYVLILVLLGCEPVVGFLLSKLLACFRARRAAAAKGAARAPAKEAVFHMRFKHKVLRARWPNISIMGGSCQDVLLACCAILLA